MPNLMNKNNNLSSFYFIRKKSNVDKPLNLNIKNMFKAGTLILLAMTMLMEIGCYNLYNPTNKRLIKAPNTSKY